MRKIDITSSFKEATTMFTSIFAEFEKVLDSATDSLDKLSTLSSPHRLRDNVLHIDMPGFTVLDINISVKDGVVTVDAKNKEAGVLNREFHTSYLIGDDVNEDKITADYLHGVLRVMLPPKDKKESAGRKIEVK
jgi:HSP20 family molecular chaperone IbpA